MSIDACIHACFRALSAKALFTPGVRVLELGETTWDVSMPLQALAIEIRHGVSDRARREALLSELVTICEAGHDDALVSLARLYWELIFAPASFTSVDFAGSARSVHADLNQPLELGQRFDLVMNLGTSEHVFRTSQCFQSMHDHAEPGALFVHFVPFSPFFGWYDHGFYNYNASFFQDLARANAYELAALLVADYEPDGRRVRALVDVGSFEAMKAHIFEAQSTASAILLVAMRKTRDAPFVTPVQGIYDPTTAQDEGVDMDAARVNLLARYLASSG